MKRNGRQQRREAAPEHDREQERRGFFFSSRRRHTRYWRDWISDVCSSDLRMTNMRRTDPKDARTIAELHVAARREAYARMFAEKTFAAPSIEEYTTQWLRILKIGRASCRERV